MALWLADFFGVENHPLDGNIHEFCSHLAVDLQSPAKFLELVEIELFFGGVKGRADENIAEGDQQCQACGRAEVPEGLEVACFQTVHEFERGQPTFLGTYTACRSCIWI